MVEHELDDVRPVQAGRASRIVTAEPARVLVKGGVEVDAPGSGACEIEPAAPAAGEREAEQRAHLLQ